jgi:hypothetical protein
VILKQKIAHRHLPLDGSPCEDDAAPLQPEPSTVPACFPATILGLSGPDVKRREDASKGLNKKEMFSQPYNRL